MEGPIYDGNIHPDEYIKKMRLYCKFRQITEEQEILELALMSVDSTIKIPENITSFDALINALKEHVTFTIFKNSCKRKLQALEYEGVDSASFITEFLKICRDAEITNLVEQRKYLINALPNDFVKNEFAKSKRNVNSTDELIRIFEESVLEDSETIRNGSIVALRHVTTGKYLSSCDKKYPQRANNNDMFGGFSKVSLDQNCMVYCDDFGPNVLWTISATTTLEKEPEKPSAFGLGPPRQSPGRSLAQPRQSPGLGFGQTTQKQVNPQVADASSGFLKYKSPIILKHHIFGKLLDTNIPKQSPMSNHFEVCCDDDGCSWNIHNQANNQGNVKSHDIILLQHNKQQQQSIGFGLLRSHDVKFTVDNENYQEVVTHDQMMGESDQWCIELVKQM